MNKKLIAITLASGLAAALAGCGSNPEKPAQSAGLPDWVMNPTIEGGIAATECVPDSGDFSLDKSEVIAMGRATLTKQVQTRVKAMDETYQRKVKAKGKTSTGKTFESVSRQVAQMKMSGSRAIKVDYVDMGGKRNLCAMVALDPKVTEDLFDKIVAKSGADLDPQSKDALYEEFKAHKAQERLEAASGE